MLKVNIDFFFFFFLFSRQGYFNYHSKFGGTFFSRSLRQYISTNLQFDVNFLKHHLKIDAQNNALIIAFLKRSQMFHKK